MKGAAISSVLSVAHHHTVETVLLSRDLHNQFGRLDSRVCHSVMLLGPSGCVKTRMQKGCTSGRDVALRWRGVHGYNCRHFLTTSSYTNPLATNPAITNTSNVDELPPA